LRDVDCDFRLIRRAVFDRVSLRSDSGTICLELVKKLQDCGFRFIEVPVHHYHRAFGRSQFFNFRRVLRTGRQLLGLWRDLVLKPEPVAQAARKPISQKIGPDVVPPLVKLQAASTRSDRA
jgi:hypothetical protein